MSGHVIIIPADDALPITSRDTDTQPEAHEIREIIGGWLEAVPHWTDYMGMPAVAFCNEDGKRLQLPINLRATSLWARKCGVGVHQLGDVLVGNVVLLVNLPDEVQV